MSGESEIENREQASVGLTDEVIADLKAKHGKVFIMEAVAAQDKGDVPVYIVFKKPSIPALRRFEDKANQKNNSTAEAAIAKNFLVADCIVWPNKEEVEKVFEEYPLISTRLLNEVIRLLRGQGQVESKKA